ncbi:MAG: hypothetical protein ACOY0T_35625 [Myxococcota bacterium]
MTAPINANIARDRLEQIVSTGIQKAGPVIARVLSQTPEDALCRGSALDFYVRETGAVELVRPDGVFATHRYALGQIVEKTGMTRGYADKLAVDGEDNAWRRELLAHSLREHFSHSPDRFLVRSLNGEIRGFLSDSFRRLDSRPLLDAFIKACQEVGAVPFEGVASDLRVSVRAILPTVYEPVPGEAMVFGLAWNNSDFGAGLYGISVFVLRLICLNGAVGESALKQRHLGGRLADNLELSQRTYDLDTATMASATRDLVRKLLAPRTIEVQCSLVRDAHDRETDWNRAFRSIRSLSKTEETKVREAFEGEDVVMLPAGKTVWRLSNALSWVANTTSDAERKLELQQAAGAVLKA